MPGNGAGVIVLDNGFLATGWGNGGAVGNPAGFLDELIRFYNGHGYGIVTNSVIQEEFLSRLLPSDVRAARETWWNAHVTANSIRVEPVIGYEGPGAGERSLLEKTIPGLAQNGDLSHVKLFASDDFLRSSAFKALLNAHPELSPESFVRDWADDFSDRIRLGSETAAAQLDDFRLGGVIAGEDGINRGKFFDPNGNLRINVDDGIARTWDMVERFRDAQPELKGADPAEYGHFPDMPESALKFWLRVAGEAVGAALIAYDAYETRQAIAEALARGDIRLADELMGGLLGRAFGGAFAGALGGAIGGSVFGLPGMIVGAIAGGIVGALGGGEIGEYLFGLTHDLGVNDLIRDIYDLIEDLLSDPVVLDLDGDGIELRPLASSLTSFDLDGDGVAERVGWVSPHDGLLLLDSNHNGLVDGVGELFGSAHVDGYDELRTLDSNNDGRIDSADPAFADLRVWRDLDSDGASTPEEMMTMAQAGILRFNLAFTQVDADVSGNVLARTGTYVRTDGTGRAMASVRFALDETGARAVIPDGADLGDLPTLPNLPASAANADLMTAMFFDPTLEAMVEELVYADHDFETFQDFADGGFIDILYRWVGVDTSLPEDPDHPHYLKVFEVLTGRPLEISNDHQRERLAEEWPQLVKQLGVQFLLQAAHNPTLVPFHAMLRQVGQLDPSSPTWLDDVTALAEAMVADTLAAAPAYSYLELFAGLTLDPATGEISGDFDSFVARFIADEPSFFTSRMGTSGGGGTVTVAGEGPSGGAPYRHPWTAWYEDQGSLLFNIASAMGIGEDYVLSATGWRWLFGEATAVHGTAGDDLLDPGITYYDREVPGAQGWSVVRAPVYDQIVFGYEGDDELRGNAGVDRLVGGPGNDLLKGGSGSDMYVYASGDGLDRIVEESGADDTIYFSSELDSAGLRVTRIAGTNDLQLHFGDPARGIVLANQWGSAAAAVEQFHFVAEDGLDAGDIASLWLATLATAAADTITGSWAGERIDGLDGNDVLAGVDGDDTLAGGNGDDSLGGGNGNDAVYGGAGTDSLVGGAGADLLAGGPGNDNLQGGAGADSYVYNPGDGDDYLLDYGSNDSGTTDTLIFGPGIAPGSLLFSRVAGDWNDMRIGFIGQAGSILVDNQNWGDAGLEAIVFADGTTWNHAQLMARYVKDQQTAGNDTIHGSSLDDIVQAGAGNDVVTTGAGADTLIGGLGNDNLQGGSGNDTYVYNPGDGDDSILDYQSSDWAGADTLIFGGGITSGHLVFSRVATDWNDIRISFTDRPGAFRPRDRDRCNIIGDCRRGTGGLAPFPAAGTALRGTFDNISGSGRAKQKCPGIAARAPSRRLRADPLVRCPGPRTSPLAWGCGAQGLPEPGCRLRSWPGRYERGGTLSLPIQGLAILCSAPVSVRQQPPSRPPVALAKGGP